MITLIEYKEPRNKHTLGKREILSWGEENEQVFRDSSPAHKVKCLHFHIYCVL